MLKEKSHSITKVTHITFGEFRGED
jgi:hypothetical protein